ncbi:MAG: hypothetical protein ABFE13_14855 [Phycisphaerales bacterium]
MSDNSENRVYVVQSDLTAMAGANRAVRTVLFAVVALFLTIACWAWRADPRGAPGLPLVVTLWVVGVVAAVFLCFRVFVPVKQRDLWIGGDFLAGSLGPSCGGWTVARYKDVVGVTLDISKDRIVGATIRARHMTLIPAKRLEEPALIVKAIFDRASEQVTWRRSWRPFTKLGREEVAALIEAAHPPEIAHLLPPGTPYATADALFSRERPLGKGLFARLFTKSPVKSVEMASRRRNV